MDLNNLNKIRSVEAPPYLFTRILQKIEQAKVEQVSKPVFWLGSFSFMILLAVNTLVLFNTKTEPITTKNYAEYIQLTPNNTLYK